MGAEFIGSSVMSFGGFVLMLAIEGKIFGTTIRIGLLFSSFVIFYIGMKIYRKYMPEETLTPKDWLIIILSLLTPFIVVSLLESLGMLFGMMGIFIWLDFTVLVVWKTEKIVDILFPRIERPPSLEKSEKLRRKFHPELYSRYSKREKKK